jgi:hypothetical protein
MRNGRTYLGGKNLTFPDEMCSGIGFSFPSRGQLSFTEGVWRTP